MDLSDRRGLDNLIKSKKMYKIQSEKGVENTFNFGEVQIHTVNFDEDNSPKEQQSVVIRNNLQMKKYLNLKQGENVEELEEILNSIKRTVQVQQEEQQSLTQIVEVKEKQPQTTQPEHYQPQKFTKKKIQSYENLEYKVKERQEEDVLSESKENIKFGKIQEEEIQQSFVQRQSISSSLKCNLQQLGNRSNQQVGNEQQTVKVYFFCTMLMHEVSINKESTVDEAIQTIIEFYMGFKETDKSLMKNGGDKTGYELRYLDEDDYKPVPGLGALDKKRKFSAFQLDQVAFCEIHSSNKKHLQQSQNLMEKMSQLHGQKKEVLLKLTFYGFNFETVKKIDPSKTVKDIFPLIKNKILINPKKVTVKQKLENNNFYRSTFGSYNHESDEVDLNMPIKYLKSNELVIEKKQFADEPIVYKMKSHSMSRQNSALNEEVQDQEILMNELEICKYQQFEVVKINERGKRQNRILGIDLFKVYNKIRTGEKGFQVLLNALKNGPTKPERSTTSIEDIKHIRGNLFEISYNSEKERKIISYEAKNEKELKQIIAKIKYIIQHNQKKLMQSRGTRFDNQLYPSKN